MSQLPKPNKSLSVPHIENNKKCIPEDCQNGHPNEDMRDQEQRAQHDYKIILPSNGSEDERNRRETQWSPEQD